MSEKRKSDVVILLKKQGKTNKVELFDMEKWRMNFKHGKRYRIRVNGKWFPYKDKKPYNGPVYYTKWEIRDLIWRAFKF